MQLVISKIQKDGVVWLQDHVLRTYRPSPTDFIHALHKVYILFIIISIFPLPFFQCSSIKYHFYLLLLIYNKSCLLKNMKSIIFFY